MAEKSSQATLEELSSEETMTPPNSGGLCSGVEPLNCDLGFKVTRELITISESVDFACETNEFTLNPPFLDNQDVSDSFFPTNDLDTAPFISIQDLSPSPNLEKTLENSIVSTTSSRRKRKSKTTKTKHASVHCLDRLWNKNGRHLKKENCRYQVVRGTKKCAKLLIKNPSAPVPTKGIHQVDWRDVEQVKTWGEIKQLIEDNKAAFGLWLSEDKEPVSDGKTKDKGLREQSEKSCNDSYCKGLYTDPLVRKLHYLYVKLVYGKDPVKPVSLCQKMSAYCCNGRHTATCAAIWKDVKHYVMFEMLQELDCQPYNPDENSESLSESLEFRSLESA